MLPADPVALLKLFAEFAGVALDLVDLFATEHPELVAPPGPGTPPAAPVEDIDPDVLAAIERGEL